MARVCFKVARSETTTSSRTTDASPGALAEAQPRLEVSVLRSVSAQLTL